MAIPKLPYLLSRVPKTLPHNSFYTNINKPGSKLPGQVSEIPKFQNNVTPMEFRKSDLWKQMQQKQNDTQKYLQTVNYVTNQRTYYIMTDGTIVEMDDQAFFKNKQFITPINQLTIRNRTLNQILKLGWLYVYYNPGKSSLKILVWKQNLPFLSFPFHILLRLAEKLNRNLFEVTQVTGFDFNSPLGETAVVNVNEIKNQFIPRETPILPHTVFTR